MSHAGSSRPVGLSCMAPCLRWFLLFVLWIPHATARADSAEVLERRLLAPCCYQQTLDIHASEPASALKQEIRTRIARGESSEEIEQDMVRRYGERVLAVPTGSPLEAIALAAMVAIALAGGVLWWRARRWTRTPTASEPEDDPTYDERLRAALSALDE